MIQKQSILQSSNPLEKETGVVKFATKHLTQNSTTFFGIAGDNFNISWEVTTARQGFV